VGGIPGHDISYFGVNHEPFEGVGGHDSPVGTKWKDIWQVGWHKEMEGVMGYAVGHPLADLNVDKYDWPDPDDPRLTDVIYKKAEEADVEIRDQKFLSGSHRETLWERAYNLVGMDRIMMAFVDEPNAVKEILHHIMDFQLGIAKHYIEAGIEVAGTGGDLGSQTSLLFSPDILNEFFVAELRRIYDYYSEHNVIISRHCCGHVEPVLETFIELGIDVLNPIQVTANNLENIINVTKGRMSLQGGISTHLIMNGPIEEIKKETHKAMWILGRGGGYFCGPDQGMPFPEDHIEALRDTVNEYGVYPLTPPQENVE
jgi:uroporphyrinogen decarboxylase